MNEFWGALLSHEEKDKLRNRYYLSNEWGTALISLRAEMAKRAVNEKKLNIRQACVAYNISACCSRYEHKLSDDNPLPGGSTAR